MSSYGGSTYQTMFPSTTAPNNSSTVYSPPYYTSDYYQQQFPPPPRDPLPPASNNTLKYSSSTPTTSISIAVPYNNQNVQYTYTYTNRLKYQLPNSDSNSGMHSGSVGGRASNGSAYESDPSLAVYLEDDARAARLILLLGCVFFFLPCILFVNMKYRNSPNPRARQYSRISIVLFLVVTAIELLILIVLISRIRHLGR